MMLPGPFLSRLNLVMRTAVISLQSLKRFSRPLSDHIGINHNTKYYLPCSIVGWSDRYNLQATGIWWQSPHESQIKASPVPLPPSATLGVAYECTSVMRKRKSKMKKHKYKKLRKRTKFLRRKLGK